MTNKKPPAIRQALERREHQPTGGIGLACGSGDLIYRLGTFIFVVLIEGTKRAKSIAREKQKNDNVWRKGQRINAGRRVIGRSCRKKTKSHATGCASLAKGQRSPYVGRTFSIAWQGIKLSLRLAGDGHRASGAFQRYGVFGGGNARRFPWSLAGGAQAAEGYCRRHHEISGGLGRVNIWPQIVARYFSLCRSLNRNHFFRRNAPPVVHPLPHHRLSNADCGPKIFLGNSRLFQVFG